MRITSGRAFRDDEDNAVVVTESLADRYFPGQDPLGRRIGVEGELTIVGVAGDFRHSGPASEPVPIAIAPVPGRSVLVKFRGDPRVVMDGIRSEVRARDPDLVLDQMTLRDSLYALEPVSEPRFRTAILGSFAGVALVLSLIGISSVTAYSAARRSHELGIRIALGGTRARIRSTMLAQAMTPVIAGLVIGIAGAFALTRLISSYLYEVSPADPAVFGAAALLLLLAATVATWIPLRRSTTIEPMEALRYE
jgi:putative ABC transport system permease protein